MRFTDIDHRVQGVAGRQHGAFTRHQAYREGASARFIARRVADDDWVRAASGVFVLATSEPTWRREYKVAELSVDGSAIAGKSAAVVHQVPGFEPTRAELWVPEAARFKHPLATIHRYAGAELTMVDGFRVTTVSQMLLDLAMALDPWSLERAVDQCVLDRKVSVRGLEERLAFYEGSRRPGLPAIRPLIAERRKGGWVPAESELEALLFHVLGRLPGSPTVLRQASMPWRPARKLRVDALLPDHNLIIEADGRRWHTRVKDFDRDQWRTNEALAHGYRTMHFTWVHLHDFAADSIDQIVRTIGGSRAA